MSALTERSQHPATRRHEPSVWVTAYDEVSVQVSGYVFRVNGDASTGVRVIADGVPPSIVSDALTTLGVGYLLDYDQAVIFHDWRRRLLPSGDAKQSTLGGLVSVRIEY